MSMRTGAITIAAAVLLLSSAPQARSSVSLAVEHVTGTPNVELRWEAESGGPFSLLSRTIFDGEQPEEYLPLDPVANLAQVGITSPLVLRDVADASRPTSMTLHQILDESSGHRSNAGYVLLRDLWERREDLLSLPQRTAFTDARAVLETLPQLDGIARFDAGACVHRPFWRERTGAFSGENFPLVPTESFLVRRSGAQPRVVLVGAAETRRHVVPLAPRALGCSFEHVGIPFAATLSPAIELLCGEEGVDWTDGDGDGLPEDECPAGGWADQPPTASRRLAVFRNDPVLLTPVSLSVDTNFLGNVLVIGNNFPVVPSRGLMFTIGADFEPRDLVVPDAGASAADPCVDTDSDGADDVSERLLGSDPADVMSIPGDRDRDAVRDADDNCIDVPNGLQSDTDDDGVGDACDPCPSDALDGCDDDDGDGIGRRHDNCPDAFNPDQEDAEWDRVGDACDVCPGLISVFQHDGDGDCLGDECDPDPDVPTVQRVTDLTVMKATSGGVQVEWRDDRPTYSLQPVGSFEVVTGELTHLREDAGFARAECLESRHDSPRLHDDTPGSRWYLVRLAGCPEYRSFGDARTPGADPRDDLDGRSPCP